MIAVLDIKLGNIGSIVRAFERIGVEVSVVDENSSFSNIDKLILPGVGAFDAALMKLAENGLQQKIIDHCRKGNQILGICLGMQLLCQSSDEGTLAGLGLIDANVLKLPDGGPVPHVGWNLLHSNPVCDVDVPVDPLDEFYFVHSYCVKTTHERNTLFSSNYLGEFASGIVNDDNTVFGFQFHPEKSGPAGLKLLDWFANR